MGLKRREFGDDLKSSRFRGAVIEVLCGNLRAATIHLALGHPELRRHLVAALRRTAVERWKHVRVNDKVRVRWAEHPDNAMLVEELPTKPVKRRLRRAQLNIGAAFISSMFPSRFLMTNLIEDARLLSQTLTYDNVLRVMQGAVDAAVAAATPEEMRHANERNLEFQESQVFWLEVEPADYRPMEIQGEDFVLTCEWAAFEATSPGSDFQQADPYYSKIISSAPGGARKLFKMLKANPDALRSISWHDLADWLTRAGVPFEYRHSVWS